jgi:2-iminobutanoate/2-iminopropanoate deaminase
MTQGFSPPGIWQPKGRGFSMGVIQPAGRVVHFTGQVAWNEAEEIVGRSDVQAQTRQCFENIKAILKACGGTLDDVVAVTTYYVDRNHLKMIQEVRAEYFVHTAPVSTSIMVAGLGHEDFLVELAPIAVVPEERFIDPT